jgi:probable HAF family extracellular repeat protein
MYAAAITPVATLGLGVSGDGEVVVGALDDGTQLLASHWTSAGGVQTLSQGVAYDISRDGTRIVGERLVRSTLRSFRWNSQQGFMDLGSLSGGNNSSTAIDISGDGEVVVGTASQSTGFRGFRWSEESGMIALGDLPGGLNFSQANSISADGQITVGLSSGSSGDRAVRWIGGNLTPVDLGLPLGLEGFSEAKGVSGNGDVVVGVWGDGLTNEAFRWTELTGYQLLGDLSGGILDSVATATSFDGSVVVGTGNPGETVPDEAFYWTESAGLRSLRELLVEQGADLSAFRTLDSPSSLSDDGKVIVGTGTLVDGTIAGFRASLLVPEPSGLVLLLIGILFIRNHFRHSHSARTLFNH